VIYEAAVRFEKLSYARLLGVRGLHRLVEVEGKSFDPGRGPSQAREVGISTAGSLTCMTLPFRNRV